MSQHTDGNEDTPLLETTENIVKGNDSLRWRSFKKFAAVAVILVFFVGWGVHESRKNNKPRTIEPINLRMYTNNIRFDNKHVDPGEAHWSSRKQLVTSSIDFNTNEGNANIVCLQEVLRNQLQDILYNLNNENTTNKWSYFGVGRTDGVLEGEFAPILFKNSEWEIIENRTLWLSDTPDVPSRGWDAALERIVTIVTLRSKASPEIVLNFFNTHFDHRGVKARRRSAMLIAEKMENYNKYPSFLCGDFNTQPTDEPYQILKSLGFKDSRTLIDDLHSHGHLSTFTGFDKLNEVNTIIDYIWAPYFAQNGNLLPHLAESENNNYYGWNLHETHKIDIRDFSIQHSYYHEMYMSDHRPVVADFTIFKEVN